MSFGEFGHARPYEVEADLLRENERLRAERERLRAVVEAAVALSDLLGVMESHVNNACTIAGIHGVPYKGPTWDRERDALKLALNALAALRAPEREGGV